MVRQERHATGRSHLELPRGFGELDSDAAEQALRELQEETGLVGRDPVLIGETLVDSGMTDARVRFYRVDIVGRESAKHERTETITSAELMPLEELTSLIGNGRIDDSFTIQAYGILAARPDHCAPRTAMAR
jgi:ADP-ribose pyrophosphatase